MLCTFVYAIKTLSRAIFRLTSVHIQRPSHILRHLTNHAGVIGHKGQLQSLEPPVGQAVDGEALVDGVIRVVFKRHLLTQHDEDAGKEKRQEYLHQSHQDLTFLERIPHR